MRAQWALFGALLVFIAVVLVAAYLVAGVHR